MHCAANEGSDQPVHSHNLIRVPLPSYRIVDSVEYSNEQKRPQSNCVDAKADLGLNSLRNVDFLVFIII